LDLLVAGIVLLLLFVATYSQRRTWITLGSTALTIVLIAGCVIFSTAQSQGSSQIYGGLAQLAKGLPAGWDRPVLKLTAAIEQASTSLAQARTEATAQAPQPMMTASVTDWFSWGAWFEADQQVEGKAETEPGSEADPAAEPDAKAEPVAVTSPDAPIKWFLDAPSPSAGGAFAVRGANMSDEPLKVVRAVLKPDSGTGKVKLTLDVEGHDGVEGKVVPPGARFSLKAADLTASEAGQLGGAILSVAYVQAGRRKSAIMYLTPPTLVAGD
jgi:hypothetical protein